MTDTIDYGNKMHRAMRGLIAEVLEDVGANGLPGEHHFFITFDTRHPDVEMADWLFDRYPSDMTIVVQHWFDNLIVAPDGFQITLNFGDNPEPLAVPFDAIRTFVDPSVEFGLRFESQDDEDEEDGEHEVVELPDMDLAEALDLDKAEDPKTDAKADAEDAPAKEADVVSLDAFRKP
ncbi:MAG: ClpXP protease specificity-enhancing factor SspB [Litoreibacter sp.]|uniref:SspB family protein n=1 Tax=Litoreibacter sp. TaxID=1969459 RepID=UPI003297C61F